MLDAKDLLGHPLDLLVEALLVDPLTLLVEALLVDPLTLLVEALLVDSLTLLVEALTLMVDSLTLQKFQTRRPGVYALHPGPRPWPRLPLLSGSDYAFLPQPGPHPWPRLPLLSGSDYAGLPHLKVRQQWSSSLWHLLPFYAVLDQVS